jgi:Protein of unknown function (DUF2877)
MLEVTDIGVVAARLLRGGARGRIAAVFERSFYVTDDTLWACIGVAGIGRGPLNVCLAGATAWDGPCASVDAPYTVADRRIMMGGVARVSLRDAVIWSPPSISSAPNRTRLAAFIAAARTRAPEMGLSRAVFADDVTSTPVLRAAVAPITAVRNALKNAASSRIQVAGIAKACIELLGLGPGLTPSGDDFVGGLLVALRACGHAQVADEIWSSIAPAHGERTSPLSAAHVRAAAEGQGAEAVHEAMVAVLSDEVTDFTPHFAALDRIGHCSGWDAMAGVVVGIGV